jgi:hypothetical protein
VLREKIPASYQVGMKGFNDFFEMLYDTTLMACRGIVLSNSASYGWRSFRIDHYKGLALCQFFLYVHTHNPHSLLLLEEYNDGHYHYPWQAHPIFDLKLNGFYQMTKIQQKNVLVDFISQAMTQALEWQSSDQRREILPARFLHGHETSSNILPMRAIYDKIPPETSLSTILQDQLFEALSQIIRSEVQARLGRQLALEPNANWFNWDFRGLRMKILEEDGSKPDGPFPFAWRIYYRQPAVIRFESERGECIMEMDNGGFYTLNAEHQSEWLLYFVRKALDLVAPNPIEIIE